jgi:sarcosine oxidase subunit beta
MRHEAARAVIVLANAGAPALLAPLGVRVPALPVCPQVLFTAPVAGLDVRHLIGHLERRLAVKQLPGGDLMISGGWLGRWDEAMQRGDTIEENVAGNMAEASAVFPALAGTAVREAYADRAEAVGPELLPLIDHVPGFSNIVLGTGWSGHGFAIAPAVVRLLAHWLLGGAKPRELAPFHWRER